MIVARLDSSARVRFTAARMLNLSWLGGLLPALNAFPRHQKVPSSELQYTQPTHSVTERSVALPAPLAAQVPKFSGRIDASTYWAAVPKYYSRPVLYGLQHESQAPSGKIGPSVK